MKAFQVDFRPLETEHSKLQAKKIQEVNNNSKLAEEWEQKKQSLKLQFEKNKLDLVADALTTVSSDELALLKSDFLVEIDNNPIFKKILEAKGLESLPIQTQWINFVSLRSLPKAAYEFDEYLKIEGYDTTGGEIPGANG